MANFKRNKPRARTLRVGVRFLKNPKWWDVTRHNRPRRRHDKETAHAVKHGRIDPDAALWEIEKRPTHYYW